MKNIQQTIKEILKTFRDSVVINIVVGPYCGGEQKVVATVINGKFIAEFPATNTGILMSASPDPNGARISNNEIIILAPLVTRKMLGLTAEQYKALKTV